MKRTKQTLYVAYDKVAQIYKYPAFANSDGDYVRMVLQSSPLLPSDVTLHKCSLPYFDKSVAWDSYKIPDSPMEAFAPLKMTEEDLNKALENAKERLYNSVVPEPKENVDKE